MHRHDPLHELDVAHQPGHVVGHQLDRRGRADPAGIQRGRMHVPAFHQAEHFPRIPADLQRLPVELTGERIERPHDVGDGAVPVRVGVRCLGVLGFGQHARVGLGDHLLAEVDADQVLLEDVVVEHVFRGLAEIDDPLADVRRPYAVGHVLRVAGARAVVVTADAADAAGDEVRVAGILALHEDRVAAEDRRRAVAFHHFFVVEVDLGVDAEAAHDPGDGIPRHLDQLAGLSLSLGRLGDDRCHRTSLSAYCFRSRGLQTEQPAPTRCGSLRIRVWCQGAASAAPCRRCVP